jgi:two-component system, OmpR family, sensor kinase
MAREADGPMPGSGRRFVIPARIKITGWVLLLTAVVLTTVTIVTRDLLLARVDNAVAAALEQEAGEFSRIAAGGVDPATQRPFTGVRDVLYAQLQRQYPDADEILVGWVGGYDGGEVLRQQRVERFALASRHDVLDPIVASASTSGSVHTDVGELRWAKVPVLGPPAQPEGRGAFVIGVLVDDRRAEVATTIRTLVAVGLIGLLVAGIIASVVAGQILAPVRAVRRTAAQISEQDLTRRIPVSGRDDIAALAEQFNAMLDRLELAFTTQRRFLDDAGHELRTPITIVRGHLEVMGDDPAERAEVVRLCTDELDRMNRIVTDLLVLATAERPDFVRPERVEVAELTEEVDAKVRALARRRWHLETIAEGRVWLDPQRITQAVVQLAQNAVQHSADGDVIRLGSALSGGQVRFWVADNGPGVEPQDTERIFQRFTRGSAGPPPEHRAGAGLGLAIVSAIAEAHGGSVSLVSEPGRGATFAVELPAGVP